MTPQRHAQVSELFHEALKRSGAQRDQFLIHACATDPELRREVESLIECDSTAAAIDKPVTAWPDSIASSVGTAAPPAQLPTRIGRYEVLGLLGHGGMGVVYLARQRSPDREVALKVLAASFVSASMLRRFEFESAVLARLQHPGIAHLYDAGVAEEGGRRVPYFAMERVDGLPITEFADRAGLDSRARLHLLLRVCDAVAHAHQKGVIHRDIKPANVLVDAAGAPKVLDFGVARAADGDASATLATASGQIVGTLAYMSPEQLAGDSHAIDVRSDVYALGVLGFQLLTRRLPHDIGGLALPEAVRRLSESDAARIGTVHRGFRGDIETIFSKALEKDRSRRYASVSELEADIRRFLDDQPILARTPTLRYQIAKFARRNRILVAGVCVSTLLLVAGIIGTTYGLYRATIERDEAIEIGRKLRVANDNAEREARNALSAQKEAEAQTRRSVAMNQFLTRMLESANPLSETEVRGHDVTVVEMLDREAETIQRTLADQPDIEAGVRSAIGATYRGLARFDRAEAQFRAAADLQKKLAGDSSPAYARALRELGEVLMKKDDPAEGLAVLQRSLELESGFGDAPRLDLAMAHARLGKALIDLRKLDQGETHCRAALAVIEQLPDDAPRHAPMIRNNLAFIARHRGKNDEARELYQDAERGLVAQFGDDHALVAFARMNLACVVNDLDDTPRAMQLNHAALASFTRLCGPDHPIVGDLYNNMTACELDRREFPAAAEFGMKAASIHRRVHGPDHLDYALTLNNAGLAIWKCGDLARAREVFREVARIRRDRLGPLHKRTLIADMYAANALAEWGVPEAAEPEMIDVIDRMEQTLPEGDLVLTIGREMRDDLYRCWPPATPADR